MSQIEKTNVIVVGNGMVGHQFIESLLTSEEREHFHVVTFSEEPRVAYDRVHLSEYFQSNNAEDLAMTTLDKYQEMGVEVHLNDRVESIDLAAKTVTSINGKTMAYDKLVLAHGLLPLCAAH